MLFDPQECCVFVCTCVSGWGWVTGLFLQCSLCCSYVFYFGFVCVHACLLRVDALCMCARPTSLYLCISEWEYVCAPVHIWGSCTPVWDNSTASGLVCCVWIIKVVSLIIKSSLSWWEPEEGDGARERGRERGIIVSAAGVHARSLSSIVYCGWDVSWAQVFSALCARPLSSPRHIRSRAHTYSYIRAHVHVVQECTDTRALSQTHVSLPFLEAKASELCYKSICHM